MQLLQRLAGLKTFKLDARNRARDEKYQDRPSYTDNDHRFVIATELNNIGASLYEHGECSTAMDLYKDAVKLLTSIVRDAQYDLANDFDQMKIQKIVHAKEMLHIKESSSNYSSLEQSGKTIERLDFFHLAEAVPPSQQVPQCLCDAFKIETDIEDNISVNSAITFFNMGLILHKKGLLNETSDLYQKAVTFIPRSYKSLFLASVFNNLGQIHFKNGFLDKAMSNFVKALQFSQKEHEERNKNEMIKVNQYAAIITSNLARVHFLRNQDDEALSMCQNVLVAQKNSFENHNIHIAVTLFNIGLIHYRKGNMEESIKRYKQFFNLLVSIPRENEIFSLKDNATNLGISLNHVGQTYEQHGLLNEAEECYKKALEWGAAHIDTHKIFAIINYNIGMINYQKEKHSTALQFLVDSVNLLKQIMGQGHPDVAAILHDIGVVQMESGKMSDALDSLSESYHLRRAAFGDDHWNVAESLYLIGKIYYEIGEYQKSLEALEKTAQIEAVTLGKNHPSVATTLCMIGQIHCLTGELHKALYAYKDALQIVQATSSDTTSTSRKILTTIGNIHLRMGQVEKARTFFKESGEVHTLKLTAAIAA